MVKVFLREKKLKHGKKGLYLDFYPPIVHPQTAKPTRRENLRLYLYERPKAETEKNHNKETKLLGEISAPKDSSNFKRAFTASSPREISKRV
jgi:hypothetical protein